jgi:signal transduction histidine kinase
MSRLIQDLLDASRVQTGQLLLERVVTGPQSILMESLEMLQPLATHADVQLETDVESGLPAVRVDRQRLVQVLSNLVGNALKFTPAGGRILMAAHAHDGGVRFTVSDTGAGIPPEQLPLIFGRFWQARSDRRGLGLGLSIAKGIVEAHGGSIWANSEVGVGSTFGFDVPQA